MSKYETDEYGNKLWRNDDGYPHREDGPAYESYSGTKQWFINGKRHREDGPAYECFNGNNYWYYKGVMINCESQEEFLRLIKMKAFW